MSESDNSSSSVGSGWVVLFLVVVGVFLFGVASLLLWIGSATGPYVGPLSFGSPDPKKAWWVIPSDQVIACIILYMALVVGLAVALKISVSANATATEERNQKLQVKATLTEEIADLEAKRDAARNERLESVQLENMRRQIRTEVERDMQRDMQAELEREHARYVGYVERRRMDAADYEARKQRRLQRVLELEKFVLAVFPDIAQRTDPTGTKGPEAVSAALRKHCLKKLDDPELLRLSRDQDVLAKLGPMEIDFPPAPPPISPPILIPIPEPLRRRFEGEEVHNMVGLPSR